MRFGSGTLKTGAFLAAIAVAATSPWAHGLMTPSAGASGSGFSEDWETTGFPGWVLSGNPEKDCSIGHSGCSLKLDNDLGSLLSESVDRTDSIPMGDRINVSFFFRSSTATATTEFGALFLDSQAVGAEFDNTVGDLGNNGWAIRAWESTFSSHYHDFTQWDDVNTWYKMVLTFDLVAGAVQGHVMDLNGASLGSSHVLPVGAMEEFNLLRFLFSEPNYNINYHVHVDTLRIGEGSPPPLPNPDADGDEVPDDMEFVMCGSQLQEDIIGYGAGALGSCQSTTNYSAPPSGILTVDVFRDIVPGPDADNDGFEAYFDVIYTRYSVGTDGTRVEGYTTMRQVIDPDDGDADIPLAAEVCSPLQHPNGIGDSVDNDGDGLPGTVTVTRGVICYDRTTPTVPPRIEPWGPVAVLPVDTDDNDPLSPSTGTMIVRGIPLNASFGADNDRDGIPGYRHMGFMNLTYDASSGQPPHVQTYVQSDKLDDDDDNRNVPVPYSIVDADGDWIPDATEPTLCYRDFAWTELDGTCPGGSNFQPPSWFQAVLHEVGF